MDKGHFSGPPTANSAKPRQSPLLAASPKIARLESFLGSQATLSELRNPHYTKVDIIDINTQVLKKLSDLSDTTSASVTLYILSPNQIQLLLQLHTSHVLGDSHNKRQC